METQTQKPTTGNFIGAFGTSLFTAFLIYILEIIFVVAFTALIYSGELSSQIPRALGFVIVGDAILCAVVAWLGSNPGAIAIEQDVPGAMLSVLAAGIIAALPGLVSQQFATVTIMIVTTTLLTGLTLALLGFFKLGGLARFLPYPVIGGFLAGSGWLMIQGGVGIMANASIGWEWFQWSAFKLWIPGLVLGIAIYLVSRKIKKPYTIPMLMLAASFLFYGVARALSISTAQLRADGWLLSSYSSASVWEFPLSPAMLSQVEWGVLLNQIPALIPVALISVIALLLNSSGVELLTKKDVDLNRELVTAGMGNLAAGMTGGLVGFQDVSFSTLNHLIAGGRRLVGLLTALLLGATIFVGMSAILYIPKFVLGAVVIYLGVALLVEWVYEAWFKFSRVDFLMVVTILITLAARGVLEGVLAGLILAVFAFVVNYSRIDIVKDSLTGASYQSSTERPFEQRQLIKRLGQRIQIMRLHGFVFFGTSQSLVKRVADRLKDTALDTLKYLILDFQHVNALDSSAVFSFVRLQQLAETHRFYLILTDVDAETKTKLTRVGLKEQDEWIRYALNVDYGMEWCESNLLLEEGGTAIMRAGTLGGQLKRMLPSDETVEKFMAYLEKQEVQEFHVVIQKGDPPDSMYFIDSGEVTTRLEISKNKFIRLRNQGGGTMVGEMGLFLKQSRTATVVANQPSVLYKLSLENYNRMMREDPELAFQLHQWIGRVLSVRLAENNHTLEALLS